MWVIDVVRRFLCCRCDDLVCVPAHPRIPTHLRLMPQHHPHLPQRNAWDDMRRNSNLQTQIVPTHLRVASRSDVRDWFLMSCAILDALAALASLPAALRRLLNAACVVGAHAVTPGQRLTMRQPVGTTPTLDPSGIRYRSSGGQT